ncbi:MAG TPA: integrase arm-type DNA-binding domain-containing protein [Nevskiales bacterium]|nr:integrase arm-type DNA-binding domain-containing protein [Nevskiales bacterium]
MPKHIKPLTEVRIRSAKPDQYPLWDGGGLHLIRDPAGARRWRLKYYRPDGRENRIGFGPYPDVPLAEARRQRERVRELLRQGTDPAEHRKAQRDEAKRATVGTFEAVSKAWREFKGKSWSPESKRKAEYVLNTYLLPSLKSRQVATLKSAEVAAVLRRIADRTPDLARKARQYVQGIIRYAIREGLRDEGRVLILDEVLPKSAKGHIPAQTLPDEIAALIKAVRGYSSHVTRAALLMCAYTAQRPGTVASMRWDEIAQDVAEWRIPPAKMKMRHTHIVPLPRQALELLTEMQQYTAGREYVFPPLARQHNPHLHRDALSNALRDMGFAGKHAPHGFRGMFRTAGRERLGIDSDVLEAQLAHAKRGDVQKAYDRTTFDETRRRAMQRWADYLDGLEHKREKVVSIRAKRA